MDHKWRFRFCQQPTTVVFFCSHFPPTTRLIPPINHQFLSLSPLSLAFTTLDNGVFYFRSQTTYFLFSRKCILFFFFYFIFFYFPFRNVNPVNQYSLCLAQCWIGLLHNLLHKITKSVDFFVFQTVNFWYLFPVWMFRLPANSMWRRQ